MTRQQQNLCLADLLLVPYFVCEQNVDTRNVFQYVNKRDNECRVCIHCKNNPTKWRISKISCERAVFFWHEWLKSSLESPKRFNSPN